MYFGRTGAVSCVKLWKMFSWPPQQWEYSLKRVYSVHCSLWCWPKMLWPRDDSIKIAEKRKIPSKSKQTRELNLESRQQPTHTQSQSHFLSDYPFAVYGNMEHAFNVHSWCDWWWEIFLLLRWLIQTSHYQIFSSVSLKTPLPRPFP